MTPGFSVLAVAALLALAAPVPCQDATRIYVLTSDDTPADAREAVQKGASRGLAASGAPGLSVVSDTTKNLKNPGSFSDALGLVLYANTAETVRIVHEMEKRGLPVIDLARHAMRGKPAALSQELAEDEAACMAFWVCSPFQHHAVAVFAPGSGPDSEQAKVFTKLVAGMPDKRVASAAPVPEDAKSAVAALTKAVAGGASCAVVFGGPEAVRVVANAARALVPPPAVFASPSGLAHEAVDPKVAGSPGPMPEGTAFFARDLPEIENLTRYPQDAPLFRQEKDASLRELDAWDAAFALGSAAKAGATQPEAVAAKLASGEALGLRGAFNGKGKGETFTERRLRFTPWFQDGARLRPFPPIDKEKPQPRTVRTPYPTTGWNTFTQWNTQPFRADAGAVVVEFDWTDGKSRTIEDQLASLNMLTRGRQPVLDHLVREKLLARVLSIASTKFLRNADGTPQPGTSFNICLVHHGPKTGKPRIRWKAYVTGDHPDAGGQAFGSYCFIYSKFIWRTIFKERALDEPLTFDDLDLFTTPLPASEAYLGGTRRDVIYRIIDGYGGSMALTAAHEIGHLAGLAHDEKDPHSIMNVAEGGGISHNEGFFIPEHRAIMAKSLGVVPGKATK